MRLRARPASPLKPTTIQPYAPPAGTTIGLGQKFFVFDEASEELVPLDASDPSARAPDGPLVIFDGEQWVAVGNPGMLALGNSAGKARRWYL